MQRLGDDSWVISASDLTQLSRCPWMLARLIDEKLGKGISVPRVTDPMMELVKRLGIEHEQRVWQQLSRSLSPVVEITYDRVVSGRDAPAWKAHIAGAAKRTVDALTSPAQAIFQGVFFQETLPDTVLPVAFQGFADFLVASPEGWEVWDSKLARSAKDPALIQLAAYADQLHVLDIETSPDVQLVLGDNTRSVHQVAPLVTLYQRQRGALLRVLEQRVSDPQPTVWDDERYDACGTAGCPACHEQIILTDDLFHVAGMRKTQRNHIRHSGLTTLTEFAAATRRVVLANTPGIGHDTLARLHTQASLQLETRNAAERPAWKILSKKVLQTLPAPHPGDVFFDFEGDPTYQEFDAENRPLAGQSGASDSAWFGIEYLFGLWGKDLDAPATPPATEPSFLAFWAENFEQEKEALLKFCAFVEKRLQTHPGMHIYHYAPYERTRLAALTARHRVAEACVERLLDSVLVDLFPLVKEGVQVGLPSYSLKALEALYFSPTTRSGIAGGGESVAAFVDYLTALAAGDQQLANTIKDSILHYNTIDCFSTEALRNWLLQIQQT